MSSLDFDLSLLKKALHEKKWFVDGEPFYLYDLGLLKKRYELLASQFSKKKFAIHYAVKANANLEVLKTLKAQTHSGADVVSGGEIKQALRAGFEGKDIIFSGVGKSREEIRLAFETRVKQLNVESLSELKRIGEMAQAHGVTAPVSLRLNPDVNAKTHPYISTGFRENKFGLDVSQIGEAVEIVKAHPSLQLVGLALHVGSQILDLSSIYEAIAKTVPLFLDLKQKGFALKTFDVGGGVGIAYRSEDKTPDIKGYVREIEKLTESLDCKLCLEPGRFLVGPVGVLLCQVEYIKETPHKNFLIVNTGMHHFMRPALYGGYHEIKNLSCHSSGEKKVYDVVGPICESSDTLGKDRSMHPATEGDWLAIMNTGAYGFSMASHYNCHELPKEICF